VDCGVGLGATSEIKIWFNDSLIYLVVFNTDSSTLGSTRF
jgi:hypothetical protein